MKLVAYLNCLPSKNKNAEKLEILHRFSSGVRAVGDEAIIHKGYNVIEADVALGVGWVHGLSRSVPHLELRRKIIETQLAQNKKVVLADSSLFLYTNRANPHHYLRYSFNGVFPNSGIYCDDRPDPARWEQISRDLDIKLRKYRNDGEHILLLLQRNNGWSMGGLEVNQWTINTINELRRYTDRPIVVRCHPGDKEAVARTLKIYEGNSFTNVTMSDPRQPLIKDLKYCWAAVNHNSSPTVGCAIEGFPIFVTDPEHSQCAEIANTDLSRIENPERPDRIDWVRRLSMFHWSFKELADGTCWRHMRKYV